jgi:hypothetical protein
MEKVRKIANVDRNKSVNHYINRSRSVQDFSCSLRNLRGHENITGIDLFKYTSDYK